jgi:hypothetical protein
MLPFLLLLIALFIFTVAQSEHDASLGTLIIIVTALIATYRKPFRDSLREFF